MVVVTTAKRRLQNMYKFKKAPIQEGLILLLLKKGLILLLHLIFTPFEYVLELPLIRPFKMNIYGLSHLPHSPVRDQWNFCPCLSYMHTFCYIQKKTPKKLEMQFFTPLPCTFWKNNPDSNHINHFEWPYMICSNCPLGDISWKCYKDAMHVRKKYGFNFWNSLDHLMIWPDLHWLTLLFGRSIRDIAFHVLGQIAFLANSTL